MPTGKTNAEQFELPLVDFTPAEIQWAANERAQAHQWTDEALTIAWWSGCPEFGADPEGFHALPLYKQRHWIDLWRHENARQEMTGRPKRSAAHIAASAEEKYQEDRKLAESWAEEIRKAFLERKPCPIIPCDTDSFYTRDTRHILDWAFSLAQIPRECLLPAPATTKDNGNTD